jgi:hypothetical protein
MSFKNRVFGKIPDERESLIRAKHSACRFVDPVPRRSVSTSVRVGTHTRAEDAGWGMGLGGTAKKLQKVAEMAEDVYARLNDLRDQVREMRETVGETKARVDALETETAEQRAILEALAEEQGIDVEAVTATAHIGEAESASAADADAEPGEATEGVGDDAAGDAESDDANGA